MFTPKEEVKVHRKQKQRLVYKLCYQVVRKHYIDEMKTSWSGVGADKICEFISDRTGEKCPLQKILRKKNDSRLR